MHKPFGNLYHGNDQTIRDVRTKAFMGHTADDVQNSETIQMPIM